MHEGFARPSCGFSIRHGAKSASQAPLAQRRGKHDQQQTARLALDPSIAIFPVPGPNDAFLANADEASPSTKCGFFRNDCGYFRNT